MKRLYDFFQGRKLFYFCLLFFSNLALLLIGKWQEAFGYFSIGLYAVIVGGVEANKYIKRGSHE